MPAQSPPCWDVAPAILGPGPSLAGRVMQAPQSSGPPRGEGLAGAAAAAPENGRQRPEASEHRQAPGASASTVNARHLWNSLIRWALRSPCGAFKSFLQSSLRPPVHDRQFHTPRSLWPIPLPHPEMVQGAGEADPASSPWQRYSNILILTLDWLHLGKPPVWPKTFNARATLTEEQRSVLARLKHLAGEWLRFEDVTAESMGRTAGKVESLEKLVASLERSAVAFVPATGSGKGPMGSGLDGCSQPLHVEEIQAAKPVEASRLAFKGRPSFDPAPYLSEPARSLYADPLKFAMHPTELLEEVPAVKVRGNRKEILDLLAALDATQRLALFTPEEVRMSHRAGMFALMKNLSTDRLILDCRPANALEPGLNDWTQTMASLVPLLSWVVPPGHKVVAAGEDLKDYYYYYMITPSRSRRNALAMTLSRAEAKKFAGAFRRAERSSPVYVPALATMATGDLNAVEFGQQSHVRLGLMHGLIRMTDLLTIRGRFPRQNWAAGYVIDDFVVVEALPRSPLRATPFSTQVADEMAQLYARVGLEANDKKRFRAEENPQFWGISIEGTTGLIRAQLDRVIPLRFLSARIARAGAASRHLLEVIAGSWTAILQARKRGMCLLETIFAEIQEHEYHEVFICSPQLCAELWTLTVLAPLFCSDLQAQVSPEFYVVDASDEKIAGARTVLPDVFAAELNRRSMTKAAWSRLLSPWKSYQRSRDLLLPEDEVPTGEEPAQAHPLWRQLCRSCIFEHSFCFRVKPTRHINLKELQAMLHIEAQHARQSPSSRCSIGTDSQVVLGAVVKGRSASRSLNYMLQRHLPTVLCYNLYPGHQYIPSADNPSDDPTRDRDLRGPSEDIPSWLTAAFVGDFTALDVFLAQHGADESVLARLPSFCDAEIPPDGLESGRALRRKMHSAKRENRAESGGVHTAPPPDREASGAGSSMLWSETSFGDLSQRASAAIAGLPLEHFCFPREWSLTERRQSLKRQGVLDLFSGSLGLARAIARHLKCWVLVYDIVLDPKQDLLSENVQQFIESLMLLNCFRALTAGPVCASFSRAVRPPVRSRAAPRGLPELTRNMQRKVEDGNVFSVWLARLVTSALDFPLFIFIENPWLSSLWDQPEWLRLSSRKDCGFFTTDFCTWGTPWRKRTRFLTNTELKHVKLLCSCDPPAQHLRLVGYSSKHRKPWTKVAESYPARLSNALALFLHNSLLPIGRRRQLDIAACAKCNSRIGEASLPGPRPRRERPDVDLETVQLLSAQTLLIQQRVRSLFASWLQTELTETAWEQIAERPELWVVFLRAFGRYLFVSSQPMYLFRHLVVFYQRTYPTFPAPLVDAWDLLSRWERVQPVEHKTPMPKVIFDAMICLGWLWGWYRFCAVSLLAFHGKLRISEPIRASRQDLLLPAETGADIRAAFINITKSKTSHRGRGIVQHTKITDEIALLAIERIFGHLQPQERLYPATPSTYRRRWDRLLSTLGVSSTWKLTPGTLRAGGAIHAYNRDPLADAPEAFGHPGKLSSEHSSDEHHAQAAC